MKVKELAELLTGLDPEAEVVMSRDAEGNGHSPLADYSDQYHYVPESTWHGWLWGHEDEEGDEKPEGAIKCVVLWPTN